MAKEDIEKYWADVRAGKVEHNPRGPDKKPRAPGSGRKSFEKRYYQKTGRTVLGDMKDQIEEIEMMKELALGMNDPQEKFSALKEVNTMRDKYNRQWAPYMASKLSNINTNELAEDQESLDDVLSGGTGGPDETY